MVRKTELAKRVLVQLMQRDMTQAELIEEVKKRSGMYCDYNVLNRWFRGENVSERIVNAVNDILFTA